MRTDGDTDGRTDGRTDTTNVIVAFCNNANALKNGKAKKFERQ
jgi:hypothetical protein